MNPEFVNAMFREMRREKILKQFHERPDSDEYKVIYVTDDYIQYTDYYGKVTREYHKDITRTRWIEYCGRKREQKIDRIIWICGFIIVVPSVFFTIYAIIFCS